MVVPNQGCQVEVCTQVFRPRVSSRLLVWSSKFRRSHPLTRCRYKNLILIALEDDQEMSCLWNTITPKSQETSLNEDCSIHRPRTRLCSSWPDWPCRPNMGTTTKTNTIPSLKTIYLNSFGRSVDNKLQSDEKSKHLLSLCKVTHQHSMAIQSRLAQVRGREESGHDVIDGPNCGVITNTPATTDGSQCSSSASTVVVQKHQQSLADSTALGATVMRCESVTSSLELGYSHTAQHSALSETCELDYSQSAHCTASSGVYTLDGSCDNHTVIETVASSSGIGLESQGPRSRSGSMASNTGSFHGDGSDPSDAGRGNLLSAEELSNLIVHRSPKPRRGVYPSRATVSSTLDSCSDYVTLPPPPIPPPPPPPRTPPRRTDSQRQDNKLSPSANSQGYVLVDSSPSKLQSRDFYYSQVRPILAYEAQYSHVSNRRQQQLSGCSGLLPTAAIPATPSSADSSSPPFKTAPTTPSKVCQPGNRVHQSDYYGYPAHAPTYLSSGSPLYSAATSYSSSSTHSLRYEPLHPLLPPPVAPLPASSSFHRTLSDDNILNIERPAENSRLAHRRPPPPPIPHCEMMVSILK
ncbi:unnamed protein product [Nesidiocoris tenuis]|uniref:Uncharacterized protein n=1 Tax=Nesidiocoris tenuis TaxID=355587 RepID=A0A6H5GKI2_9HEMI|nr:unnamed protein product [Nesidiocoris tenuis]